MKRLLTLVVFAAVAASVALGGTKTKQGGKPAGTKAGLTEVANDYIGGIKAGDVKKIGDYFAPDYTFTDLDGKVLNRAERLKAIAAGGNSNTVFSEINVRTYGTTGVITGMATNADGSRTRFTMTWIWQGGRWLDVAAQRTSVTP
ncbi:MAG: nuclear transport factor 2 family protein [Pyrinomonadaceae bacterium]